MISFLFELIRKTAVSMPEAKPYGTFHLCFFLIGMPLAVILGCVGARRGSTASDPAQKPRICSDPATLAVGIILILGEAYKQLFYPAVEGVWRADLFPFQLCSVPMYVAVTAPFIRNERASRAAYTFLATYGLMGGVASYISPGTMLRPYLAMTLHSFLWHLTLVILGVRAAVSGRTSHSPRGFADTAIFYLCLCAAAFAVNLGFHGTHPEVNMFYLGPTPSTLPLCRGITARFGWQVNSVLYILALTTCAFLIHLSWLATFRAAAKRRGRKS